MRNPTPLLAFVFAFFLLGCSQTTHRVVAASQGAWGPSGPSSRASERSPVTDFHDFEARLDEPGPITFEKHVAADWVIPRKGLINLHHETAKAHHLENGPEPIQIYFYILNHPEHGSFMVDSGVARSVKERKKMPVRFPVTMALPIDDLQVHLDTKTYLESRDRPLSGVFLTHLHLDHILGLTDVSRDVPIYIGPGEAQDRRFTHFLMRPTTNLNLKGFEALREWQVIERAGAPFAFVDIFADGSVLGLHIPGHTKGSMAFIVRTTEGPVLLVGDGSHTVWGWEHSVEPGTFNTDMKAAASSLDRLGAFVAAHPTIEVHLGHQSMPHGEQKKGTQGETSR